MKVDNFSYCIDNLIINRLQKIVDLMEKFVVSFFWGTILTQYLWWILCYEGILGIQYIEKLKQRSQMRQTPCGNILKEKSNNLKRKAKLTLKIESINKMMNNWIVIKMALSMKQIWKNREKKKKSEKICQKSRDIWGNWQKEQL